jgi:hypothetical protein
MFHLACAFRMELFLNLCWLSLLAPAWLLWRRHTSSTDSARQAVSPLVFAGVLGCAFVLLFPVISATDDLHAMRPEMEESERTFRHTGQCTCHLHAPIHSSQPALPIAASLSIAFEPVGTILPLMTSPLSTLAASASAGRAPPIDQPASL